MKYQDLPELKQLQHDANTLSEAILEAMTGDSVYSDKVAKAELERFAAVIIGIAFHPDLRKV